MIINQITKGSGVTPTGTIQITNNGITDVTNYATADVQVPTTAPTYYVKLTQYTDAWGTHLVKDTTVVPNLSGVSSIGYATFWGEYANRPFSFGSGQTSCAPFASGTNIIVEDHAFKEMFYYTQFDNTVFSFAGISNLGQEAADLMFAYSNVTKVYFPDLTYIDSFALGAYSATEAFKSCTDLTEIHFPAALQSQVESMSRYSNKWGATNATIYFDL